MSKILGVFVGRFGRVALFNANEPVGEHAHSQVHVLIKVDGADGIYDVDGVQAPITDDQVVLVNPWVPHANSRQSKAPSTVFLALYLEPMWIGAIDKSQMLNRYTALFPSPRGRMSPELRNIALQIAFLIKDSIGHEEQLEDLLLSLMQIILRKYCGKSTTHRFPQPNRQIDYRIRKAVQYMRERTSKRLVLDDVAAHVGLSRSRFYEQFKACMGVSPRVYLDTLCIELAIHRLTKKEQSLAEISEFLGFSAQSHFSRFFRSKIGVPPSEIRSVIYDLIKDREIPYTERELFASDDRAG